MTSSKSNKLSLLDKSNSLHAIFGNTFSPAVLQMALSRSGYSVEHAVEALFSGRYNTSTSTTTTTKTTSKPKVVELLLSGDEEEDEDEDDFSSPPPRPKTKSSKTSSKSSPNSNSNSTFLLVTDRWVTFTNTTRGSNIPYNANVQIHSPKIVNEKNTNLRYTISNSNSSGSVPPFLSAFLAPLLLSNLIQATATTLMEVRSCAIGSDVPVRLRIKVNFPRFFDTTTTTTTTTDKKTSTVLTRQNFLHFCEFGEPLPYTVVVDEDEDESSSDSESNSNAKLDSSKVSNMLEASATKPSLLTLPDESMIHFRAGLKLKPYQLEAIAFMRVSERSGGGGGGGRENIASHH